METTTPTSGGPEVLRFKRKCGCGKPVLVISQPGVIERALKQGMKPDCKASKLEYLLMERRKVTPVWNEEIEARMREELHLAI